MEELEHEYEEPTGISTVKPPELSLDGVLLSQNCGVLYEVKHVVGLQYVCTPPVNGRQLTICQNAETLQQDHDLCVLDVPAVGMY